MAHTSSLRVYAPLDGFVDPEREYWEKYTEFERKWWGGTVFTRFWFWMPEEEYRHHREELAKFLDRPPERIAHAYFFQGGDGIYYISPHGDGHLKKGYVNRFFLVGEDRVPIEWFVPFQDDERSVYRFPGQENIFYSTRGGEGRGRVERVLKALDYLEEKVGEKVVDLWDYYLVRLGQNLKNRSLIILRWFELFPVESYVVLEYGGVAELFSPQELDQDHSAKDLWALLISLEWGNLTDARFYLRVLNDRWGKELLGDEGS